MFYSKKFYKWIKLFNEAQNSIEDEGKSTIASTPANGEFNYCAHFG